MNVATKPARDERRDAILAIARQVFMEEGFAAASMSAIAARVGGSKGTLYNYFRSKSELFGAVIRDRCAAEQASMYDIVAAEKDTGKALILLGRRLARLLLSDDIIAIHRTVVAESARFPEIGEAHYEAGPRQGKVQLAEWLVEETAAGRLNTPDPRMAAEQYVELITVGLYRRRLWSIGPMPTEAEIDATVDSGVAVFMAAYGPAKPQA